MTPQELKACREAINNIINVAAKMEYSDEAEIIVQNCNVLTQVINTRPQQSAVDIDALSEKILHIAWTCPRGLKRERIAEALRPHLSQEPVSLEKACRNIRKQSSLPEGYWGLDLRTMKKYLDAAGVKYANE